MEKKQTGIKIVAVIVVISVITLFVVLKTLPSKTVVGDQGNTGNTNTEGSTTETTPEKPKKNYTIFPKPSCNYLNNSRLNNIGGTGTEKLLNSFIIGGEIFLLVETNSNGYDFSAETKSYAVATLDLDLNLISTKILKKSTEKYLGSTIFSSGILLVTANNENTTLSLYDEGFNLEKSAELNKYDFVNLQAYSDKVKMLGYNSGSIELTTFNLGLEKTSEAKINLASEGFYQNIFSYVNKDIFINFRGGFFDICKIAQKLENDKIYYVIERICTIKGVIRQLLPLNEGQTLLINFTNNSKTYLLNFEVFEEKFTSTELGLITDNVVLIPQNSGYILHDYVDNGISILDEKFRIIIHGLNKSNRYSSVKGEVDKLDNSYLFITKSLTENNTEICSLNYALEVKSILKIPYVSSPITIKKINHVTYVFLTTNNNQEEFSSCYGSSDVFAIKLNEF